MRFTRLLACLLVCAPLLARADEDAAPAEPSAPAGETVKGELSSLGATKLLVQDTRIGLRAGATKIGQVFYVLGSVEFDLRKGKFGLGLGLPVRIPAYDPAAGLTLFPEGLDFRREEYDELSELMRLVRYATWGKKEENLFVNVSTEYAATIGHGLAVRRYLANIDVDRGKLSAEVDAYGKYGGVETFVADVLHPERMLGFIGFVKPFGGSKTLALQRLSIGATYAADFTAPWKIARDVNGLPQLEGDVGRTKTPVVAETKAAQMIGLSIETKVVKTEHVDVKPYVEAAMLVGGGAGLTLGGLGRFAFGDTTKMALRAVAELRAFQGNFLPGYFDTFYEVQRFQYITGAADPYRDVTKLADVLGRPSDLTLGYYTELQWSVIDAFAVTAAWEDSPAKGGRNLVVHGEIPVNSFIRGFVSAHRRAVEGSLFDIGREPIGQQLKADNTLFFAGARVKILPILYVNLRAFRAWKMDPLPQTYRNVDGFEFDLEVGYEFEKDT